MQPDEPLATQEADNYRRALEGHRPPDTEQTAEPDQPEAEE